ncbi:hypothetical protein [Sulfurimonas sp.]|uniref:hypothetical protein n=1 Tax=Sulfurimonas sp. TaxID=2022749 RepID=UPI00261A0FBE|nr:hypothetical protein [Sulfurimonas sp.]MCW8894175.1 hypothetical protein [Sulfurimonas sp.]
MYQKEMKPVIIKSLDYSIKFLSVYKGYDGANILKFIFHDNQEMLVLRDYCRDMGLKTSTKMSEDGMELYCIFEASDDVYALK